MGVGSENANQTVDTLVPEHRRPIIDEVIEGIGMTMSAGTLLDATRTVTGALIVQKEAASNPAGAEANADLAQSAIDEQLPQLGRNREALGECDGDPAKAAELSLERIRGLVDAAYGPAAA